MLKHDGYLLLYIKEAIGFAQARRICRLWAAGAKGIFSFAKENIPFGTPRERLRLAVSGLNNSDVSEVKVPRARRSRVSIARRFASAPTIRCCAAVGGSAALRMRHTPCGCRSAHLVEVRSNFRLPPVSTMRRAPAMPHSVSSLPPFYRHSRLTTVRRGCWMCRIAGIHGEAMYTAPTLRSACSHSSLNLAMSGVEGPSPRPFSWGCKGDILFLRKRISPFAASPHGVGPEAALPRCTPPAPYGRKKKQPSRAAFLPRPRRESCPNCQYGILIPISPLFSLDNMQY